MKENVFLADCAAEEVDAIAAELMYDSQPFEIRSHISNWKRTGLLSELRRYGVYFRVGFQYFLHRSSKKAIVGWQQFYALIFCFFCSFFSVKKSTFVLALNFTYKKKRGALGILYRWFMGKCVDPRYLDYIHVLSEQYADAVAEAFHYPRSRILVSVFGVNDDYPKYAGLPVPVGYEKDGYALAIGRSNRDYDFLIRAWKGIDYPLVIISDTYTGTSDSENVVIWNNVAGKESYPWIAHCGLMILPIDDGGICSGDTVLLTSMAVQRKIIVTAPSTLAEMYLEDGKNALLAPKEEAAFRSVVIKALTDERFAAIGEQARIDFLNRFSRKNMGRQINRLIAQEQ